MSYIFYTMPNIILFKLKFSAIWALNQITEKQFNLTCFNFIDYFSY